MPPGVMKSLGLEKESKVAKAKRKAGSAGKVKVATVQELDKQVALLESATKTLEKAKHASLADKEDIARSVVVAATKIRTNLDEMTNDPRLLMHVAGRHREWRERLHNVKATAQGVVDQGRVGETKAQAGEIYFEAGRRGPVDQQAGGAAPGRFKAGVPTTGGFAHLTDASRHYAFGERNKHGQPARDFARQQEAGKKLGLSPATIAAIKTFTNNDYQYINPATANSMDWMKKQNAAPDFVDLVNDPKMTPQQREVLKASLDKTGMTLKERQKERRAELMTKRDEGALHESMALQGLLQLPVWKGTKGKRTTFRGEVMNQADFAERFPSAGGKFLSKDGTETKANISSQSKLFSEAEGIWSTAMSRVEKPHVFILHETELTNGRDIEFISTMKKEAEVATLPGATFQFVSGEMRPHKTRGQYFFAKWRQTK